jgi:hypothetical protein
MRRHGASPLAIAAAARASKKLIFASKRRASEMSFRTVLVASIYVTA